MGTVPPLKKFLINNLGRRKRNDRVCFREGDISAKLKAKSSIPRHRVIRECGDMASLAYIRH